MKWTGERQFFTLHIQTRQATARLARHPSNSILCLKRRAEVLLRRKTSSSSSSRTPYPVLHQYGCPLKASELMVSMVLCFQRRSLEKRPSPEERQENVSEMSSPSTRKKDKSVQHSFMVCVWKSQQQREKEKKLIHFFFQFHGSKKKKKKNRTKFI